VEEVVGDGVFSSIAELSAPSPFDSAVRDLRAECRPVSVLLRLATNSRRVASRADVASVWRGGGCAATWVRLALASSA
jgi:hypothetical protein